MSESASRARPRAGSGIGWLLLPAMLLYGAFLVLPTVVSVPISLFDWSGTGPIQHFVGLENFSHALHDPVFRSAALHNAWLFILLFLFTNTVSLGMAHLLDRRIALRNVYRAVIFLPYVLSTIAIGFIWQLILSPNIGVLNPGLEAVGLDTVTREWLGDPDTALWVLIAAFAWQWNALATVVFLAGLQSVRADLRESAVLDGANGWQVLRHVTVPALAPAFSTTNVLLIIVTFRAFELAYVLTGPSGAPDGATLLMGVDIYRNAFASSAGSTATTANMSYAMAQGVLLSLTLGVVAFAMLTFLGRRERDVS